MATARNGFGSRQLQVVAMLVVLLLVLEAPVPTVARFMVWNSRVKARRDLQSAENEGVAIDLMQFQHVDSPYAQPNLTRAQRVEIAVKSSQARAQFFHSEMSGKQSSSRVGVENVYSSPVYAGEGSYIMQINLGTPARKFVAIADTGSDLVWVQCAVCTACNSQPDAIFNPKASTSYAPILCTAALCTSLPTPSSARCSSANDCLYQYAYGDKSSTAGDFASETLTLTSTTGSAQAFSGFAFGCGHRQNGYFSAVDGLVGLGKGPQSLVSQLGSTIGNVFSYCLVSFDSAITKTSPLLLGSPGTGALVYTPLVSNRVYPYFYYVTVVGITVGGTAVQYPAAVFTIDALGNGGLILDSGTTVTQMDSRAYKPFRASVAALITYPRGDGTSSGFDLCYDLSGVASPAFPAVVFKFQGGLSVALPANNVFILVDTATACLAFQSTSVGLNIFGSVQQQNFQIAYDIANSRVGFAPKTC